MVNAISISIVFVRNFALLVNINGPGASVESGATRTVIILATVSSNAMVPIPVNKMFCVAPPSILQVKLGWVKV